MLQGPALMKDERALPRDHVLATLYAEHEHLSATTEDLLARTRALEAAGAPPSAQDAAALVAIARTLIAADPHHRREEEVLFPLLEARGLFGPPRRMRFEHDELRALKARLLELASELASKPAFRETIRAFAGVARSVSDLLREHIRREDEVLYPMSLQVIDDATWRAMKAHCDRIGYCPFTPPLRSSR